MALSFKKIFKKSDDEQIKVGKEQSGEASQAESAAKEKKDKHGEPGFCCGSCSQ